MTYSWDKLRSTLGVMSLVRNVNWTNVVRDYCPTRLQLLVVFAANFSLVEGEFLTEGPHWFTENEKLFRQMETHCFCSVHGYLGS